MDILATLYRFEDASPDLPRPSLAAQRALGAVGVRIEPGGWVKLSIEQKQALAIEGAKGTLDHTPITALTSAASIRQLVLINKERDPNPDEVPQDVLKALGPARRISVAEWRNVRALDRYVLSRLSHNPRLIARAWSEIFRQRNIGASESPLCSLGHCELRTTPEALANLAIGAVLEGRAFVLARTAGVRAARRASELLDLHADREAGPIELDHAIRVDHSVVLWQSHASTWEGTFFPAASLLAVTTAAIALQDMLRTIDPRASIGAAGIYETPWQVGGNDAFKDEPTQLFGVKR